MTYEAAQHTIIAAESELAAGRVEQARSLFLEAARMQEAFVGSLAADKLRTRSVFGLSAATLYYRADALEAAERLAHRILGSDGVDARSAAKLEDLLSRIYNERFMKRRGLNMPRDPLSVILRGRAIAYGLAPPDVVAEGLSTVLRLLRRYAGFLRHDPPTRSPLPMFEERYAAFVAEPVPSSYRVDLYLASPGQLNLDLGIGQREPSADEVIEGTVAFIRSAIGQGADVAELVPDQPYRDLMLRLVRNMVPDGGDVNEIEVRRAGQPKEGAAVVTPLARPAVAALIRRSEAQAGARPRDADTAQRRAIGVLRAMDLDARRFKVDRADGAFEPLRLPDELADDVVAPLLNKEVVVTLSRKEGRKRWRVLDMYLATDEDLSVA